MWQGAVGESQASLEEPSASGCAEGRSLAAYSYATLALGLYSSVHCPLGPLVAAISSISRKSILRQIGCGSDRDWRRLPWLRIIDSWLYHSEAGGKHITEQGPMDWETENHLAALLMEEARRLRLQAEKGVGVYLRQPIVRGRPNARFLTATVLGVQQANRAVEVNEMWRAHEKELELDNRLSHKSKDTTRYGGEKHRPDLSEESACLRCGKGVTNASVSHSSSKCNYADFHSDDDGGLRDDEVEEFLQSRSKRGRGAVGSRMDEPGPYPVCTSSDHDEHLLVNNELRARDERKQRILGPEKPLWLLSREQHEEDSSGRKTRRDGRASRSRWWHSEDGHTSKKSRKKSRKDRDRRRHHHKS